MVVVEVPVGKRIFLDRSISRYSWFDVRYNQRGGFDLNDEWDRVYGLETGHEYMMTPDGPKKVESLDPDALKKGEYRELEWDQEKERYRKPEPPVESKDSSNGYRYRGQGTEENKKDTPAVKANKTTTVEKASPASLTSAGTTAMSAPLTTIMEYFL